MAELDQEWERKGLSGPFDQGLIDMGCSRECVTWVCQEHIRHCTHLGQGHEVHQCYFCKLREDRLCSDCGAQATDGLLTDNRCTYYCKACVRSHIWARQDDDGRLHILPADTTIGKAT